MITDTHVPQLQSPEALARGVSSLGSPAGCEGGPVHASAWLPVFPGTLGRGWPIHHCVSAFTFT